MQGKGWTQAKDLTDDDVVATRTGDVRVMRNTAIPKPVRVYNFTVAHTPSYFVGQNGLWVHNAKCEANPSRKAGFEEAKRLGFDKIEKNPPFNPHGQKVFTNGRFFITPDVDSHKGGVWKMFDSKGRRVGTFDGDLRKIGK